MNGLIQSIALGAIRTGAASAGAWLVAQGYMQQDSAAGFIGSVCFLAALGFSVFDKIAVKGKIAEAHATDPAAPLPFK